MKFDGEWIELFNERAAILEYDAGMNRREAEEKAAEEVKQLMLKRKEKENNG